MKTAGHRMTFGEVLKKQFETQKELYVTPTIIILSSLPETILTFSFACTQLNDLQRHTLLCCYLLSYGPQVLGFILYVLPSTTYKKEFYETFVGKKSSKLMLRKKTRKTDNVIVPLLGVGDLQGYRIVINLTLLDVEFDVHSEFEENVILISYRMLSEVYFLLSSSINLITPL
jgi:hypothetical protein